MKRFLVLASLLLFVFGSVSIVQAADGSTKFNAIEINRTKADDYRGLDTVQVKTSSGVSIFSMDSSGNIYIHDSDGTIDEYIPRDKVVYINSVSQLSTWAGQAATAGQSIYQLSPGVTHLFDLEAIAHSGAAAAAGGTTAFGAGSVFSGVSAIAPDASVYSGPAYDFSVGVICDDANDLTSALSGVTLLTVWPYPGSGATSYNANATTSPQSIHVIYTTNGTTGTNTVTSGASCWELNKPSELITFGLEDGGVSVFPRVRHITN